MEIERLEFIDAVRWLADRMGIQIPTQAVNQESYEKKETVYNALRFAAEYYVQNLHEPETGLLARQYLEDRRLSEKTVERFQLGYAPILGTACLSMPNAVISKRRFCSGPGW